MIHLFLALAAGILVQTHTSLPLFAWVLASAVPLATVVVLRPSSARRFLLLACVVALGALRGAAERDFPNWLLLRAPQIDEVTGVVVSYPSLAVDRIRFVVQPDQLPARVLATWMRPGAAAGSVHYGDRVRLTGRTELPGSFDGFDYGQYLERQGIFATMRVDSEGLSIAGARPGALRAGDRFRQTLLGSLRERLTPRQFALAQSYVFGDRYALSDETEEAFAETGLMHILAVSGMHLAVLLAGAWWALKLLHVRPAFAYLFLSVVVLAAVWMIGPWVSFVRSALLFAFVAAGSVLADLGFALRRSVRPMNMLAAAAFVLLLADPQYLFDVGFQLSVAATAGLLALAPKQGWPAFPRLPRRTACCARAASSLLFVSLAAQAGAAPILALQFGKLQIWTAVTGIAAIPVSSVALWLGIAALVATPFGFLGSIAAHAFGWTLDVFESVVAAAARLPWSNIPADNRIGIWLAGLVVLLFVSRELLAGSSPLICEAPAASLRHAMAKDRPIPDNGRPRLTGGRRGSSLLRNDAHRQRVPDWVQSDPAAHAEAGEVVARALRVVPRRLGGPGEHALRSLWLVDAGGSDCIGTQRRSRR
jgi:competence protein ComEC